MVVSVTTLLVPIVPAVIILTTTRRTTGYLHACVRQHHMPVLVIYFYFELIKCNFQSQLALNRPTLGEIKVCFTFTNVLPD